MARSTLIEGLKAAVRHARGDETQATSYTVMVRRIDDDALKRLWSTRLPDKELAARLGHHRSVIRRRAAKLGLKPRRVIWTESE